MNQIINLNMTYSEALTILFNKYGAVPYSYFEKESYDNFMNKIIDEPIRTAKNSRTTKDGLFIHHILENRLPLLSTPGFLFEFKVPFEYQESKYLIYCNLIEHFILHMIIGRETNYQLGIPGAQSFIGPELNDWFVKNNRPTLFWKVSCYNAVANSDYDVPSILKEAEQYYQ